MMRSGARYCVLANKQYKLRREYDCDNGAAIAFLNLESLTRP
jgi:hypothetical protein